MNLRSLRQITRPFLTNRYPRIVSLIRRQESLVFRFSQDNRHADSNTLEDIRAVITAQQLHLTQEVHRSLKKDPTVEELVLCFLSHAIHNIQQAYYGCNQSIFKGDFKIKNMLQEWQESLSNQNRPVIRYRSNHQIYLYQILRVIFDENLHFSQQRFDPIQPGLNKQDNFDELENMMLEDYPYLREQTFREFEVVEEEEDQQEEQQEEEEKEEEKDEEKEEVGQIADIQQMQQSHSAVLDSFLQNGITKRKDLNEQQKRKLVREQREKNIDQSKQEIDREPAQEDQPIVERTESYQQSLHCHIPETEQGMTEPLCCITTNGDIESSIKIQVQPIRALEPISSFQSSKYPKKIIQDE